MIQLNFDVDLIFVEGINRLKDILGYEYGDDYIVRSQRAEKSGVKLTGKEAVVFYTKKHTFFRGLGVLLQNIDGDFEIYEDDHFEVLSTMIDASRCAVPRVSTVKRLIDYLAVMGYSMAMLYTEDTVEVKERPYFGYMRGRYTCDEIKAIDDYAFEYGIEIIPCIECYGHMEKYLIWQEASPIKDTAGVLLAREEKTFEFLDDLIRTVSSSVRSNRIHIGMDEAWDMGRGEFLNRHGYVPPFEIFNEFMERLIGITDKYCLKPMMWSDMYFRVCSNSNKYYDEDIVIPDEVSQKIPDGVELVFWHYGEKPYCDDYMLKKHKELGKKTIYAGGTWGWVGHFPENNYTMETTRFSLEACRNNGVHEAMLTLWFNDNAECDIFSNLLALSYFAELCYDKNISEEKIRLRFEASTGGNYDAFMAMSLYHNDFENCKEYDNFHNRFLGKPLFWQDIMEGLYDSYLFDKPMSRHYADCCEFMKQYDGKWSEIYRFAQAVFDYLAVKTFVAEKLVPSYRKEDKETLGHIAHSFLPLLKEKVNAVHEIHKLLWMDRNKIVGWSNLDIRYAGVLARCDTAIMLIERYLNGEDDIIEELEVDRLVKPLRGFVHYSAIATPNLKI